MAADLTGYQGDDEKVRALQEDVHQITELQKHPGWQVFTRYAQEWLGAHEDRMRSGQINDLNEYKLTAGRADGVRQMLELPARIGSVLAQALDAPGEWQDEFTPDVQVRADVSSTEV